MSQDREDGTLFGDLLPGDVLVHCRVQTDVTLVTRVGQRLDFVHLVDGRYLESWVPASSLVPGAYEILRGAAVLRKADPLFKM